MVAVARRTGAGDGRGAAATGVARAGRARPEPRGVHRRASARGPNPLRRGGCSGSATSRTSTTATAGTGSTSTGPVPRTATPLDRRAGAAADPRRRLGDRRQGAAGPAAHAAPRRRAAGCASRSTTGSQPDGHVARPPRRLQARAGVGAASTSPSTAATPTASSSPAARPAGTSPRMMALTANDPQYQPGFEDADTSVRALRPVLRRLRLHRPLAFPAAAVFLLRQAIRAKSSR